MSMTAAELFEVVKDVPREAWPDIDWTNVRWVDGDTESHVTATVAEHAFIGSMTAWLMQRDVFASKSRFEETYWTIDMNNLNHRLGNYKSLVAALAAACKEAA